MRHQWNFVILAVCVVALATTAHGLQLPGPWGKDGDVRAVRFSSDGTLVWSGDDRGHVIARLASNGEIRTKFEVDYPIKAISTSPDGAQVAAGDLGGKVTVWSLPAAKLMHKLDAHLFEVSTLAFAQNGWLLVSGSTDRTVKLWQNGKLLRTIRIPGVRQHPESKTCCGSEVTAVAADRSGGTVAIACIDGFTYLLALETNTLTQVDGMHGGGLTYARPTIHLDAKAWTTASVHSNKYIAIRSGGVDERRIEGPSIAEPTAVAFSNDGKRVAIGTGNGIVSIWSVATGEKSSELDSGFFVTSIQFSPDGRTLAVGTIGFRVQLWDVNAGKKLW